MKPRRNEEAQAHIGLSSHRKKIYIIRIFVQICCKCGYEVRITSYRKSGRRQRVWRYLKEKYIETEYRRIGHQDEKSLAK
jgi:hypothetical protein